MKKAISKVLTLTILVIIVVIVILGAYIALSSNIIGNTSTTSQTNSIMMQGFTFDPSTSNLSGTIVVNSRSPMIHMDVYINRTMMGTFNYSSTKTGTYSMMISATPNLMPMLSRMSVQSGMSYDVMMVAHFSDGSKYATSMEIIAGNGMMSQTTAMMHTSTVSTGMMQSSTTTTMMPTSGGMMP